LAAGAAPGLISETARADGVSDIIIAAAAATPSERVMNCLIAKPRSAFRTGCRF
jgi:hypothetical protein